ncbi:hypothetical protein C1H46_030119 [Malus baccata]|uniref:Uncharacterized protein n=1 Tax=Malus baccata TaxID=106549 RepID=A0A540LCY2_MALBA|nr:hypothetical protein C1H46_030119 [Malus baccata]
MLQCLSLKLSSSSSPSSAAAAAPNGNTHSHPPPPSQGGTSSEASPSATLTHEYTRAVQSQSYNEIWSKVHQSQCRRALDVFLQFDLHDNPFPSPDDADSPNLDNMRRCFSQLKLQLDSRLRSSRSKIRLIRRATLASALCFIGTAVGVAVSAVAVTVHALTAALVVVAAPPLCCTATSTGSGSGSGRSSSCCNCRTMTTTEKKEIANMKQLDAAAMGTCVLDNDLATIDRLVRRLHAAVEGDKLLVRLGLERGSVSGTAVDKHPIQEVLKQLHKSHPNFLQLVDELEEHICLCFNTVNSNVPSCIIALRTYHLLSAALLTDEGSKMRERAHSAADSTSISSANYNQGLRLG